MDKQHNSSIIVLSLALVLAQGMDTLHYLLLEHSYRYSSEQHTVGAAQDSLFHHCEPKVVKTYYTHQFDVYPLTLPILNVFKKFDVSYQNPLKQASKKKLAQRGPPYTVS